MRATRRSFLAGSTALALTGAPRPGEASFDAMRPPDRVTAYAGQDVFRLERRGAEWRAGDIAVTAEPGAQGLPLTVSAPRTGLERICLRWNGAPPAGRRYLGDHWERGYGDLEWRGLSAQRVMPWYFLMSDGNATRGFGVKTGARAFCFWMADDGGISLWLDVRNGGGAVRLGERILQAATVVSTTGPARDFCRTMCAKPMLPAVPVYGGNNWYYAYGRDCSADLILRDCGILGELSPTGPNRPFMVIDDGWEPNPVCGPWERGNAGFSDLARLAAEMKARGVRPGIWIRPLYTAGEIPQAWRLAVPRPGPGITLDPSVPEVTECVRADIRRLADWGFDLIKHDYSTFDLLGRWGFDFGAQLTDPGWHFADSSRTTAEIVLDLYRGIREAAGNALLIGCNTVGHLAAGLVEMQRIGDDTSGKDWNRTRKMGVNSLAFRMPQHGAFFACDGDCAGLTKDVPWQRNRLWLDLLARSGTPLFVSIDPAALGPEQKKAVREAFARAARVQPPAEPLDGMETTTPSRWRFGSQTAAYDWFGGEGANPFG